MSHTNRKELADRWQAFDSIAYPESPFGLIDGLQDFRGATFEQKLLFSLDEWDCRHASFGAWSTILGAVGSRFDGASLRATLLKEYVDCSFVDTKFYGDNDLIAKFRDCSFTGSRFRSMRVVGSFAECSLDKADFSRCVFVNRFENCAFRGVTFKQCGFEGGADVRDCTFDDIEIIESYYIKPRRLPASLSLRMVDYTRWAREIGRGSIFADIRAGKIAPPIGDVEPEALEIAAAEFELLDIGGLRGFEFGMPMDAVVEGFGELEVCETPKIGDLDWSELDWYSAPNLQLGFADGKLSALCSNRVEHHSENLMALDMIELIEMFGEPDHVDLTEQFMVWDARKIVIELGNLGRPSRLVVFV